MASKSLQLFATAKDSLVNQGLSTEVEQLISNNKGVNQDAETT
jgi:hypothetical protein